MANLNQRVGSNMKTRESHTSADGTLTLVVIRQDGDITVGFDGLSWHTHGDVLVGDYQLRGDFDLSPEAATRRFVADVLDNRAILAVSRADGVLKDVWVTDSPADDAGHASPSEEIEFRYWNGTQWRAS